MSTNDVSTNSEFQFPTAKYQWWGCGSYWACKVTCPVCGQTATYHSIRSTGNAFLSCSTCDHEYSDDYDATEEELVVMNKIHQQLAEHGEPNEE